MTTRLLNWFRITSFTGLIDLELMFIIIGLIMAPSWFMESNDILKDTIIDAISHKWHCIVAIYSFHLIVSSFKQRDHSILKKTFDFKDIWQRKVIQGWQSDRFYDSWSINHIILLSKDCFKSLHRNWVLTIDKTTVKSCDYLVA